MDVRVLLVVGVRTIKSRILPRIVDDVLRHYEHVVLTVGTTSFHSPSTSPKQNSPSPSSTRCSVACWLPYAAVARPGLQDPYAGPLEVLLRVVHEDLYLRGRPVFLVSFSTYFRFTTRISKTRIHYHPMRKVRTASLDCAGFSSHVPSRARRSVLRFRRRSRRALSPPCSGSSSIGMLRAYSGSSRNCSNAGTGQES